MTSAPDAPLGDGGHELTVTGLRAGVAGREVLTGIDLTVRSGEVHAIMGPNGSGKSTLSHVLMGKPGYEVLGGSVRLDGVELLGLPTWRRARLGLFLAPQYPTEVPGVRLQEALAEALRSVSRLCRYCANGHRNRFRYRTIVAARRFLDGAYTADR